MNQSQNRYHASYCAPYAQVVKLTSGQLLCASIAGSGTTSNYSEFTLEWED